MKLKYALAGAAAASLLAFGQAQATQIWYTVTGTSNVFVSGIPNITGFFIPNVSFKASVVGDTANYADDPVGIRLIPTGSASATVSASGTGTVVLSPGHFLPRPVSFT